MGGLVMQCKLITLLILLQNVIKKKNRNGSYYKIQRQSWLVTLAYIHVYQNQRLWEGHDKNMKMEEI